MTSPNRVTLDNGRITLINGDCLEILPKIKPNCVDMVFADLPYGTTDCSWDQVIPFTSLWPLLHACGKQRTPYVFTAREPFTSILVTSNIKQYHHKWVWNKKQSGSFQTAKQMPLQVDEDVIVFGDRVNYYPKMRTGKARYKGGAKKISREQVAIGAMANGTPLQYNDQYYPTNIIDLANLRKSTNINPTQKPLELLEYMLQTYSSIDDVILDPTAGSGTTAEAAITTRRRCIAIERDTTKGYFEYMIKRCEAAIAERDKNHVMG